MTIQPFGDPAATFTGHDISSAVHILDRIALAHGFWSERIHHAEQGELTSQEWAATWAEVVADLREIVSDATLMRGEAKRADVEITVATIEAARKLSEQEVRSWTR